MKEKIIAIIERHYKTEFTNKIASQIVKAVCEEIEKVENPYKYFGRAITNYQLRLNTRHAIFEECRQKILALLKEK